MLADIYTTLQGIIQYDFPKNTALQPVVFDRPILGWYYGDRSLISETPGIVFQGQTSDPKDVAYGTKQIEHKITISCWDRADANKLTEERVLEFTRLVYEVMLPHRRMWVLSKCPLCPLSTSTKTLTKWALSPEHFVIGHSGILGKFTDSASASGSYVSQTKYNMDTIWQQTHSTGYSGFVNSRLATGAFNLMYDDVENNVAISGMSTATTSVIKAYQANKVRPIRLLYDCVLTGIKPCEQNNDKSLFRGGEFTLTAKENIVVSAFGPDNVPTSVWG